MAESSNGLGDLPFKEYNAGSTPVSAANFKIYMARWQSGLMYSFRKRTSRKAPQVQILFSPPMVELSELA